MAENDALDEPDHTTLGMADTASARLTADQLRQMADALPHLVWTCLAEGPCDYLSRQWVEYTGIPEAEQLGYGWLAQLHPDDRERIKSEWAATVGLGAAFDIEFRIRRADGVHRWFRTRAIPLRDPSGTIIKWYGSNTDVDDYKRGVEMTARLASIVESSDDAIVGCTLDGVVTSWNQAAERLFGYTADEVIGQPLARVIRPDRQPEEALIFASVGRNECIAHLETIRVRKDGREIDVSITSSPIRDPSGNVFGISDITRDISDRKRAEQALDLARQAAERDARRIRESETRYRKLAESGIIGILASKLDDTVLQVNDTLLNMLGYSRDELASGAVRWAELTPPEWKHLDARAIEALKTNGVATPWEKEYIRKDGSRVPILIGAAIVEGSECVSFVLDLSGRKRAEGELKQAHAEIQQMNARLEQRVARRTAELEAANKDLEGFSYSVSHDLRAPLRAIDSFSNILLEDYAAALNAEGQRLLHTVRRNTEKMDRLIQDMLAFSRAGRRDLVLTDVDVASSCREIIAELLPTVPGRKIEVRIGELPRARADAAMLRQVLVNLLSNAVKFTGRREHAEIDIAGSASVNQVTYSIRDNGAGFNPDYTNKLFGVFQRLHSDSEFPGTGVGLAIVKRVIGKLGGRVWAEGEVDRGATFHICLPSSPVTTSPGAPP